MLKHKIAVLILSVMMLWVCGGCSENTDTQTNSDTSSTSTITQNSSSTLEENLNRSSANVENSGNIYQQPTEEPTEEPTEYIEPYVQYIGDRDVDFDRPNDRFRVFFALKDQNKNPMTSSGEAKIVITNNDEQEVYNKTIKFTEKDFTDWTNYTRDTPAYKACIYIPKSDIKAGSSETGKLMLEVFGEDYSFDPDNLKISGNLPLKSVGIKVPQTPIQLNDYGYSGNIKSTVSIKEITSDTNLGITKISLTIEMLAQQENSSYTHISYKLKNSKNIIIDSGTIMVSPMSVGETIIEHQTFYDLSKNEEYTLELSDHK